jgi:hypothetical protein
MFLTNQQTAEVTEPLIGPLHDPLPFVSPHFVPVVIAIPLVVPSIRGDQGDGPLLQTLVQRVGVLSGIGD